MQAATQLHGAFSALSPGLQRLLRRMRAVRSYSGLGQPDHPEHSAVHPLVRCHPGTGVEGLYVNCMFGTRFEGMTEAESRPLLEFLDRHTTRPEFTCRVSWEVDQVVMWDNRFTLHYPINDFSGERRLLLRCTPASDTLSFASARQAWVSGEVATNSWSR